MTKKKAAYSIVIGCTLLQFPILEIFPAASIVAFDIVLFATAITTAPVMKAHIKLIIFLI